MTVRARWLLCVLCLLGYACLPSGEGAWQAMPPLIAAVGYAVAAYAGYITVAQAVIMIAVTVYGAVSAKENARRARNQARDAYNASLQDRTVNLMSTDAPWQIVLGEAVVGGTVVAVLTSGDKDQYKHVVVEWAHHECEAITDVLINGVSLGALDGSGYATGAYVEGDTQTTTLYGTVDSLGRIYLDGTFARVVAISRRRVGGAQDYVEATLPGSAVTFEGVVVQLSAGDVDEWMGLDVAVTVDRVQGTPRVRVRHHLGAPDQLADSVTMAECPGDWTSSDRGRGACYSIVRLDLNEPEFQGGPPQFTARVKGLKATDPRTGTTAWTSNNAVLTAAFLQAEWGKQALSTQLVTSSFIASANACDEALVLQPGAKRFTCNGSFRTDQSTDQTLTELCQSMAGFVTYTGAWHLQAGVYTEPVMDLNDADNRGSVEGVADESQLQTFNGLRGQFFDPARVDQRTDYPPYQNAGFVAEDGEEQWAPLNLPFTNRDWRCHNLARIQVERARGMKLVVPAKRRALKLRPGNRVRYSNSLLQISAAVFRVVKREYQLGRPVMLTLEQDAASNYDEVDAPAPLASPAVHQTNPFVVGDVGSLAATSGTATLLLQADGTVLSRVKVTWAASTDTLVTRGGALQIEYRRDIDTAWQRAPEASGSATEAYLLGLEELELFVIRARWRNGLGAVGDWSSTSVLHVGKSEPPADPTGFAVVATPGGALASWDACPDADYLDSILYAGATFGAATEIWRGKASSHPWPQPAAGTYTLWLVHRDTSQNPSDPVSAAVTLTASTPQVELSATAFIFSFDAAGAASPSGQSITLTFVPNGLSGTTSWAATLYDAGGSSLGAATLGGSGNTRTLGVAAFGAAVRCVVTATLGAVSKQVTIARVKDGAAGQSVQVQYSVTGTGSWHSTFTTGDLFMRQSTDGGATWSAAIRIVGEQGLQGPSGGFIDYVFKRSATPPSAPTGGGTPAGWFDAPPAGSDPLYMTSAPKNADDSLQSGGAWSTPVRLDGPAGAPGQSVQVQYSVTGTGSWHSTFTTGDLYMRQSVDGGVTWSAAIRIVGETGTAGGFIDYVFKRSATPPSAPTGGGTPAGWFDAPPAGSDPLYMTSAPKNADDSLQSGGAWSTPVRLDGAPGQSVQVEYSVTGTGSWHSTFTTGDLFMRQSVDGGATWSAAIRIVGETGTAGGFIDYVFKRSATAPSTPTGDGTPSGWFDEPPAGSDPLYTSTAPKNADNTLASGGAWSAPVRLDGPAGAPGQAVQVQYSVTGTSSWHGTFTAGDLYMRQSTDGGVTWSAAIRIVGEQGTAGVSTRTAYALVTSGSTPASGTRTSTGATGLPANNAWGLGEVWSATQSAVAVNQTLLMTVGQHDSTVGAGGTTTWDRPFPSEWRVGALQAITVNTGALTVNGRLTMAGGSGGEICGGDYTSASWPTAGLSGFYLGPTAFRMGNYNGGGGFVEISADGSYFNVGQGGGPLLAWSTASGGSLTLTKGTLSAPNIDVGSTGVIKGGQTAYDTGTGFHIGYSGGAHRLSLGSSSQALLWDGAALTIRGGTLSAPSIDVGSTGVIKGGQSAYNTGTGFHIGYSGGVHRLSIGNPGGAYLTWNGSVLSTNGMVIAGATITNPAFDAFTASVPSGGIGGTVSASTDTTFGSRSVSVSGGTGPLKYQWAIVTQQNNYLPRNPFFLLNANTSTVIVKAYCQASDDYNGTVQCTVTDANGRTATASFDVAVDVV